jgi:large subunit ribosomal protein L4
LKNLNNETIGIIELNPYFFDCPPRKDILHKMVIYQLAKRRQGTHKTKYRHETAYSTRKVLPQKGKLIKIYL